MDHLKHRWKRLPSSLRRPLVLIIGFLLILLSLLIGWVPGPGGMIPFLLGIAVLATEFVWAERLRDTILHRLKIAGAYIRKHPKRSLLVGLLGITATVVVAYAFYTNTI